MPKENAALLAFNRGLLSHLGLARIDLKRTAMSSEIQTNWMPRVLGSMMLRPGLLYTGTSLSNKAAIHIPFIFATTDTAILEFTDGIMRVKLAETAINYASVASLLSNPAFIDYVANGNFATGGSWTPGTGWTLNAGNASAVTATSDLTETAPVTLINGKTYTITYTVTRSAGSVVAKIGGGVGTSHAVAGTFTENIVASSTQAITFSGTGFTGSISAVSIQPVDNGWLDLDQSGGVSTVTGGQISLTSNGIVSAIREQSFTPSGGDVNKEHCLRIVVSQGPVTFSVGSSSGDDSYVTRTTLGTGTHYLSFTPTGIFYVRFSSTLKYATTISACQIFTGELQIATGWPAASLQSIRWDQSADVVYIAARGIKQYKVERRSTRSWSVVVFEPTDGPFRIQNTTPVTITPSAIHGNITLTASAAAFKSTNVGSLYNLPSIGQQVSINASGDDQFSDPIRVTGISTGRAIIVDRENTFSATITLQRSVGDIGNWVDVTTYTTVGTVSYNDALDNQIIYYRIGIKTGNYVSGEADLTLTFSSGSIDGIAKIVSFVSPTVVNAIVLKELGGTGSVIDWSEGDWSDRRGYPSSVALYEGRLWWAGKSKVWGSVSDAYESYDDSTVGDAGPINRSIGSGPVDNVNFLLPLQRLIIGTEGAEWPARSTSLDEPLTPSNFNLKSPSTQGSANVPALKIDDQGLFVQKGGIKLYQMTYGQSSTYTADYTSADLCEICPEVGMPGIARLASQRQPDTRIHCALIDGRVAVLVSQPAEDVKCWLKVETDGFVEDVFTLPGTTEDQVYYLVRRLIAGNTVRYLEKWALETDCRGGTVNKQADAFVYYNGTPVNVLTGLAHLEGESVVCWADGIYQGQYIVSSGQITLNNSVQVREAVTGKDYDAVFLGSKLAYAAAQGTALTRRKKVDHLGLILADTHASGLYYGPSLRSNTNAFLYSDQFDNAKWTKADATVTANSAINPLDGAMTADRLVELATTAEHLVSQTVNLRQTDNNVMSVYAKAGERAFIRLKMTGDGGTISAIFDLSQGIAVPASFDNTGTGTSIRAKIEAVTSKPGWYRCSITGICDNVGTFGVLGTISLSSDGSTISYLGDITKGVTIFRAQIEPGKKASDAVLTTVSRVKVYLDLDPLPQVEMDRVIDQDEVWDQYDQPGIEFEGKWNTDSRVALVAHAPKPVTVLAAVVSVETDG